GAEELALLLRDAIAIAHDLRLAPIFQRLVIERRAELDIDRDDVPLRIHSEEGVQVGLAGQAVPLPDDDGLFPETEIHDRAAVARQIVHRRVKTFTGVHSRQSPYRAPPARRG